MKNIFVVVIIFNVMSLFSCANTRDKNRTEVYTEPVYSIGWYNADGLSARYITYAKEENIALFPDQKENGPCLEFFVDAIDILDGSEQEFLRQTLYNGMSCQDYVSKLFEDVKNNYLKIRNDAAVQPDAQYNWSYLETFDGAVYPSLFVVSRNRYIYSGGAHGQTEKIYFMLDTKLLSQVSLEDILQNESNALLQKQIDNTLCERYRAAPGASLKSIGFLEDTAGIPENFFMTREGIGFCWNQYEIAPYSMGAIEIVLPYDKIENLLNDRGKALFASLQRA
jgi:hypothetical protein